MLALAAASGPVWLTRVGVVLAVLTGLLGCVYAWREGNQNRRTHSRELVTMTRRHGRALTEERRHNAAVLDVLADRVGAARAEVARQHATLNGMQVEITTVRGQVTTLRREISTLRADNAALRHHLAEREATIGSLRDTVRAREGELAVLLDGAADAEVHGLPRRVRTAPSSAATGRESPDVLEEAGWGAGQPPAVAELVSLDLRIILPNYEGDRKLA